MSNQEEIRKKAHKFYEKRGRKDGYDLDDWLRAELVVCNKFIFTHMKCMGIVGLLIAFAGSIFAAYDNFSTFNTLNTYYVPACKQWNIIVSKIEPHTANSRVPIEKMPPFYTVERKNKEFDILLSIIKSNSKAADLNADKLILSVSQVNNGTRLGGSVILATGKQQWFVTTPDILLQWVRDFRKTWFLKWGLILIAIGTLLRIIKEIFL